MSDLHLDERTVPRGDEMDHRKVPLLIFLVFRWFFADVMKLIGFGLVDLKSSGVL